MIVGGTAPSERKVDSEFLGNPILGAVDGMFLDVVVRHVALDRVRDAKAPSSR